MSSLPTGTVTFLFTDIESSTRLAASSGSAFPDLVERHRALIRGALDAWNGREVGTEGDSIFAAFQAARDAIAAALDAQRALAAEPWPEGFEVRVRMGIHTGEAHVLGNNYVGVAVVEAARIADAGHGGQILLSNVTADLTAAAMPDGCGTTRLGAFHFKGLDHPLEVHQLLHPSLAADFPPLRTRAAVATNLPARLTAFVGRHREIGEVADALAEARLVTIHGPGGAGKTRLALEVASSSQARFDDGVWFVDLAPLREDASVVDALVAALPVDGPRAASPDQAGAQPLEPDALDRAGTYLGTRSTLIVLDNCEHVVEGVAAVAAQLMETCPRVAILATSQRPLEIEGELVYPLAPLPTTVDDDESAIPDAVALFLERARRHDAGFAVSDADRALVSDICRRLDGLPLAIELAAAHVRTASLEDIARRLNDRFSFLNRGTRTAVERQQTLRSAIDWGFGLLSHREASLLARLSVFAGGFSLDAAESVCAGDGLDPADVYELLSSLVDRSLVARTLRGGRTRYYLLETIREYGAEKLATSAPVGPVVDGNRVVMRREGEVWAFERTGVAFRLKDSKGLRYLAVLVASPGREVGVIDLVDAVEGGSGAEARRAIGDAGAVTDHRALKAYRDRLASLDADLDQARAWNDEGRIAVIEDEIQALTAELRTSVNIQGQVRVAGSTVERARVSVTKALKASLSRIAEQDADLGKHLESALRTGGRCAYEPVLGDPAGWRIVGS